MILLYVMVMFDDFIENGGILFDIVYIYECGLMEWLFGKWIWNCDLCDEVVIIGKGVYMFWCMFVFVL